MKSDKSRYGSSDYTHYASTPHLFVYQPQTDEIDSKPEAIYSSAVDIHKIAEKVAIQKITEKYDSLKKLAERMGTVEMDRCIGETGRSSSPAWDRDGVTLVSELEEDSDEKLEVTEQDIVQVEMFFRGHKTEVFVCSSLANLYLTTTEKLNSGTWELQCTGIPVLLMDYGETRSRDKRKIQVLLAEKGTGFMLWKDIIDNLSNYAASDDCFHTMHLSDDHRQVAGFSFDSPPAAREFFEHIQELTSNPANISLSGPNSKRKNKAKKPKAGKFRPPRKADISQPCCFQHVTSVDAGDRAKYYSLQALVNEQVQAGGIP